jgi:AcrR family transcriptional regulator
MPKAFTEHEKEVISRRLLDQGYKLFSTYGLRKTNIEEIAKAAGISKGAFYNFYESKEALFMDIVEEAETRVRQEVWAVVDVPGPTPRARMFAVLKKATELFQALPLLQLFAGSDFDLLFRRLPEDKLQEHLTSDRAFLEELIARCQQSGIPVKVHFEQLANLLYPLMPSLLHGNDFSRNNFGSSIDPLLEMIAAYCLGEVELELQQPVRPVQG